MVVTVRSASVVNSVGRYSVYCLAVAFDRCGLAGGPVHSTP